VLKLGMHTTARPPKPKEQMAEGGFTYLPKGLLAMGAAALMSWV
jgi:hypothetical protein